MRVHFTPAGTVSFFQRRHEARQDEEAHDFNDTQAHSGATDNAFSCRGGGPGGAIPGYRGKRATHTRSALFELRAPRAPCREPGAQGDEAHTYSGVWVGLDGSGDATCVKQADWLLRMRNGNWPSRGGGEAEDFSKRTPLAAGAGAEREEASAPEAEKKEVLSAQEAEREEALSAHQDLSAQEARTAGLLYTSGRAVIRAETRTIANLCGPPAQDLTHAASTAPRRHCTVNTPDAARTVAEEIRDEDEALLAVKADGAALRRCSARLRRSLPLVLDAVSRSGRALRFAAPALQANVSVVRAAVANDGRALQFAAPHLQQSKEVVLAAVSKSWRALRFAAPGLRNDADLVLVAVRQNIWAMHHCGWAVRADSKVMLLVCRIHGRALRFGSSAVRNDPIVVHAAIRQAWQALKYAGEEAQRHPKYRQSVIAACAQNGLALQFVSPLLQADRDVVLFAMSRDSRALDFADASLRSDGELVLLSIKHDASLFHTAPKSLRMHKPFVVAVLQFHVALLHAAAPWNADPEVRTHTLKKETERERHTHTHAHTHTQTHSNTHTHTNTHSHTHTQTHIVLI